MTDGEFEFSDGPGLTFSRAQVEAWVGHPLTDDQVADIEEALPLSTLPETVDAVAHEALGVRPPVTFSNEGLIGGVQYVTVLDAGGNPLEYNIPIDDARDQYLPKENS